MLPPSLQDSLPAGWLAFAGRASTLWIAAKGFRSSILLFWTWPGAREVSLDHLVGAASKAGCQLVLRFFHCASWGVRDDTASAALAVRFPPIHPFATGRVEGIPIPFVRPVAERIAKPWSFRLERR